MKLTAVVVARKGSKRIPNKRYEKIGEYGLVERKVRQLKESKYVNEIIVGSDDEELKNIVEPLGARFVRRPDEYCDEISKTPTDMIKNMLSYFESSHVLWAHPTNPFITAKVYDEAVDLFIDDVRHDSLFSATTIRGHFVKYDGKEAHDYVPLNFSYKSIPHQIATDLAPIYGSNGGIFLRDYASMVEDGRFFGDKPKMMMLDTKTGWDIDYPWQLAAARVMENED